MRQAGADVLSLALIDARNHSLHVAGRIDASLEACADVAAASRARGMLAQRVAQHGLRVSQWCDVAWPVSGTQHMCDVNLALLHALEGTLERLAATQPCDRALAPFRAALEIEDRLGQDLIRIANRWANSWAESKGSLPSDAAQVWGTDWPAPHALTPRQPVFLPGRRWTLGESPGALDGSVGGFAWSNERHHTSVQVPAFNIDAQPVSWAQFVEFVADGGYDRPECWSDEGWTWLQAAQGQALGRRAPLHVEHLGVASGAVMQRSFGRLTRRAGTHSAMHLNWFEADAFARWVGRRLPTEIEWEVAAATARAQGFRWGDVMEWTCDRYHDLTPLAHELSPRRTAEPVSGHMSMRGASFASRKRNKLLTVRMHAPPTRDDGFFGFRTCSH